MFVLYIARPGHSATVLLSAGDLAGAKSEARRFLRANDQRAYLLERGGDDTVLPVQVFDRCDGWSVAGALPRCRLLSCGRDYCLQVLD